MIILDPTWSIEHLRDHQGGQRHSLFVCVGEKLQRYVDEQGEEPLHPLSATLRPVRSALLYVVDVLGGPELKAEVRAFLDAFQHQLRIPYHVEEDSD